MSNVTLSDPYKILGISRNATDDQIRKAYRRLARQHHPDVNGGDEGSGDRFRQLGEAYEILSDPARRREFDMQVNRDAADQSRPCRERKKDMWPWLGRRGEDLQYRQTLSREEAFAGTKKPLVVIRQKGCPDCHGSGSASARLCRKCRGKGLLTLREVIELDIPSGSCTGDTLLLPGKGEAGWRGGPPGDILVELVVRDPTRPSSIRKRLYENLVHPESRSGAGNEIALK